MAVINYERNKVTGYYTPVPYPVRTHEVTSVHKEIARDFNSLTSLIEHKYSWEYLKVCAFYNKLFPSLRHYDWSRSSYNSPAFTWQDQERDDTGTGMVSNYLKAVIDLIVARIGNTMFDYKLSADQPTVLYSIYKDEIERTLKALVRKNKINRLAVESFHDAAILSFAHVFIDPWSHEVRKIADWEFASYESEFVTGKLKRVMIRDFAFPVASLGPYVQEWDEDRLMDLVSSRQQVDLRLYIDCFRHKKYVAIGGQMSEPTEYPFDEVLLSTYSWDMGVKRTTVTSLFDALYPIQRALNKLMAKKTQLLSMYKGPVPVFSHDADIIVKQISNAAGEALFLDTQRDPATLMAVLDPTPLDPQLNAEVEALKATEFELAGVQQISMDIENYRSAAAVIALDQIRDSGFQSQLFSLAEFTRDIVDKIVLYMSRVGVQDSTKVDWSLVKRLLDEAYFEIKPVHSTEASSGVDIEPTATDYTEMGYDRCVLDILQGKTCFEEISFLYDLSILLQKAALTFAKLNVFGYMECDELKRLELFLVQGFIQQVQDGQVQLIMSREPLPADIPLEGEAFPEEQEDEDEDEDEGGM